MTTYPVELGGSMGGLLPTQPVAGVKARVNPGRPITAGADHAPHVAGMVR